MEQNSGDSTDRQKRGLTEDQLRDLFDKCIKDGDTTGVRTIGHALLMQTNPEMAHTVDRTEIYEDGSIQRFMQDGTIEASDDGGRTWWTRYSAGSDLWYYGPDDYCGMYE